MVVDVVMGLTSKITKQVDWAIKCGGDFFAYSFSSLRNPFSYIKFTWIKPPNTQNPKALEYFIYVVFWRRAKLGGLGRPLTNIFFCDEFESINLWAVYTLSLALYESRQMLTNHFHSMEMAYVERGFMYIMNVAS